MKVFLGGTCNGSTWREDVIPKLTIDYFNPVLDEWSEEAYHAEVAAKLDCNYFFYCLSPKYTGYFSFAEVVNESFHYKNQTIFCFIPEDDGQKFTEAEIESLQELGDKVIENGGLWLDNLDEVANFLNSTQENRVELNKYDFFISYGRKHSSSLASKMNHSFIKEGKSVWMDKFCIPLGVDFQKSIEDGITKSDNFVYIISPHSVQSEYCTNELEVALKYGKRIIPVLHIMEPGMDELMHPEIQKLNWIYFDAERKFQHGLSELLTLASTDQGHLENNTRWLQKAVEWDSNKRNNDFLLSETETILAEDWYNDALEKKKSPPPSELNGIFIKESAKAVVYAKKRAKRVGILIRLLSVFMFIALIFSIYYWRQSKVSENLAIEETERADSLRIESDRLRSEAEANLREATKQRKIANDQKQIAEDNALDAQRNLKKSILSERQAKINADRARRNLVMANEQEKLAKANAIKADSSAGVAQINEQKANTLLLQSLAKSLFKQANDLRESNPELSKKAVLLAYDLNKDYLGNSLNKDAYHALFNIDAEHTFEQPNTSKAINAIERVDDYVVVGDLSGAVKIYKGNELFKEVTKSGDPIVDIATSSSNYGTFISVARQRSVQLFGFNSGKLNPIAIPTFSNEAIEDVHINDNGELYICTDKYIYEYSLTSNTILDTLDVPNYGKKRILGQDDNLVAVSGKTLLNIQSGQKISLSYNVTSMCLLRPDYAILGDERGNLIGLNLSDLTRDRFVEKHDFEVSTIAYNAKEGLLYTGSVDQTVRIWSLTNGRLDLDADVIVYDGYNSWVRNMALDNSGNWLVLGGDAKKIEYIPANYNFLFKELNADNTTESLNDNELKQLIEIDHEKLTALRANANTVTNE